MLSPVMCLTAAYHASDLLFANFTSASPCPASWIKLLFLVRLAAGSRNPNMVFHVCPVSKSVFAEGKAGC